MNPIPKGRRRPANLPEDTQHSVWIILLDEWNGRLMATGNGEFFGTWSGFAAVSSDLGHEGNNGSFAYHNDASLYNCGWHALHDAVVNDKIAGCSAGGKQGLTEVEMFPDDFDGLWVVATALNDEVLSQFDPQDGVTDNIIMGPRRCIFHPDSWNWENWNEEDLIALSDSLNPGNARTGDFDISTFYNKNGKLIHYHNFMDPFHRNRLVNIFLRTRRAGSRAKGYITLDDFYRFFLVPKWKTLRDDADVHSVPDYQAARHDVLRAIMAWVENGTAPDAIVATKFVNDDPAEGLQRQHPLCPYPDVAVYDGEWDVDKVGSWKCTGLTLYSYTKDWERL
ncbi:tannase and feruloyl esterase-domain-containing protein [Aspergillus oleicola]